MKYNQPYGISDPDAPYINGNPSTGTMGSIPPAASIEFPQREIVKLILDSGLTPDNADLAQLVKAMKRVDVFNVFKASVNNGTAGQWSATIPSLPAMPPPVCTTLWFKPNFDSLVTGAMFSVNGSSFVPVVFPDLVPISLGDIHATAWLLMMFDGTQWQVIAGSNRVVGMPGVLQKNADWYVNAATGDDNVYDGTSPTVQSVTVGPFRTIQRGAFEVLKYNMNGYSQKVHVADGTYNERVLLKPLNGAGRVYMEGNTGAPQNVAVHNTFNDVDGSCCFVQSGGDYSLNGFRLTTAAPALDGYAIHDGMANIQNLRFGKCNRFHICCEYGGYVTYNSGPPGPMTIEAGGDASSHIWVGFSSALTRSPRAEYNPAINILGACNFPGGFISVGVGATANFAFSGGISGGGFATGPKFNVSANGVIASGGAGVSHFPGSVAGVVSTGGQYV